MKSYGWRIALSSAAAVLLLSAVDGIGSEAVYDCHAKENRDMPTTIEITLARRLKDRTEEIKTSLAGGAEAIKVRVRLFPFLDPPTTLGVGRCVPAEAARRAIAAAVRYNRGVDRLIFQEILPHHWVKIGSSDTDEQVWVPIGAEELNRLIDPALSNEEFQALYRTLATPKERRRPFGMGSEAQAGAADRERPDRNRDILVELFLAPERKGDLERIKREFASLSVTRVRPQFFRLGNPPENLAIGREVPAAAARAAIRLAIAYNQGVKFLLPQFRFSPHQIAIGTSAFDEASQIPISPEDLQRLSDPGLATREFHALYRRLTGEDRRLPTYLK